MMEIELKYTIPDKGLAEKILQDAYWREIAGNADWKRIRMEAVYYDTADHLLRDSGIAYRVRREGEEMTATVKFKGHEAQGLHQREEINLSVSTATPKLEAFAAYDSFRQTGIDPANVWLEAFMRTDMMRHCLEITWQDCRCEAALDIGCVSANGQAEEICELELELIEGNRESLLALGEMIRSRYSLVAETRTKFSRGLALCQALNAHD